MKIAVFGAGAYGKYVHKLIDGINGMSVPFFFDNNSNLWGKIVEGIEVRDPKEATEIDGIIIAVKDKIEKEKIYKSIKDKLDIKIYKQVSEIVPEIVYWDISGWCNAKCKYCITGRMNNERNSNTFEYLEYEDFKKYYRKLVQNGIISKETNIGLYNWGEPFLNPDIMKILAKLSEEEQKYSISTNASIFRKAEKSITYEKCESIVFSMPGFSQESYDKAHGFKFQTILKNILEFKTDMLKNGFQGKFVINAHQYTYSEKELPMLQEWAEKNDIIINAYHPYLAGNTLIEAYLNDNLIDMDTIKEELNLNWKKELNTGGFVNPLCNYMTIDHKGRWTICCISDSNAKDYAVWGNVLNTRSYQDYLNIRKKILSSETCKKCEKYSMAYRILNNEGGMT